MSNTNSNDAVANLKLCWDSLTPFIASLDDEQWAVQSLCPDWTVGGIVAHLAAVEDMLAGEPASAFAESLPFEKVGAFMTEVAALDRDGMIERFNAILETRQAELNAMTDDDLAGPSMTPVGPGTYGRFMAVRVFDFWVHEQDMRMPLGLPGHESGPAAEMSIDEIEMSLGYIMGKKVGLEDGRGITIDLTGPVTRTMHVKVDGRAGQVPELANPDATLTADSTTFALLACGRIDPQDPIDDGRITWSGDAELGERVARNLRFTM